MNQSLKSLRLPALAACLLVPAALSQNYSIRPAAVTGGGGTSTGGGFSVSGSIGQWGALPASGGSFQVTGGIWGALVPVQQPGAPTLSIQPGGPGLAIISWAPATQGFLLQYTDGFGSDTWHDAASGGQNPVQIQTPPAVRFYRLIKP